MASLRIGALLCVLLMAGCAGIKRAPQSEAPPVAVAPAAVIVSSEPQRAPAAPPAEPVPAKPPIVPPPSVEPRITEPPVTQPRIAQAPIAQPPPSATVERGTAMTAPVAPPAARAASGTAGRSVAEPAVSEPKAPAKVAAPPVRATVPAPAVPPVPAVLPAPTAQVPKAPTPTPAATKPEAHPPLDLKLLETRLKETKAIGVFTKLSLKNQIDDLLDRFRAYYQGRLKISLAELRRAFDMLVLKTLALLQDADPPLAGAIAASRESIWSILSDPAKFPKD